jgi:hypothetical protein
MSVQQAMKRIDELLDHHCSTIILFIYIKDSHTRSSIVLDY